MPLTQNPLQAFRNARTKKLLAFTHFQLHLSRGVFKCGNLTHRLPPPHSPLNYTPSNYLRIQKFKRRQTCDSPTSDHNQLCGFQECRSRTIVNKIVCVQSEDIVLGMCSNGCSVIMRTRPTSQARCGFFRIRNEAHVKPSKVSQTSK